MLFLVGTTRLLERNVFFFVAIAGAVGSLFAQQFLGLRDHAKKHFVFLSIFAWVSGLIALLSFVLPYSFLTYATNICLFFGVPALFSAGVVRWRQGNTEAGYYTVAFMSLFFGVHT